MTPLVPQQSRLKKFSDTTVVLSKINGNTLSELPDISSSSNQNETVVQMRATTRRRKTRLMSPRNPHIRKIFELKLKMGQQRKLSQAHVQTNIYKLLIVKSLILNQVDNGYQIWCILAWTFLLVDDDYKFSHILIYQRHLVLGHSQIGGTSIISILLVKHYINFLRHFLGVNLIFSYLNL